MPPACLSCHVHLIWISLTSMHLSALCKPIPSFRTEGLYFRSYIASSLYLELGETSWGAGVVIFPVTSQDLSVIRKNLPAFLDCTQICRAFLNCDWRRRIRKRVTDVSTSAHCLRWCRFLWEEKPCLPGSEPPSILVVQLTTTVEPRSPALPQPAGMGAGHRPSQVTLTRDGTVLLGGSWLRGGF